MRAGLRHLQHRLRAVAAHAGEHHADGLAARGPRDGAQQGVHRGTVPVDGRVLGHAQHVAGAAAGQLQVAAAGRDVRDAGAHHLVVLRLLHVDAAQRVEPARERLREAGRHVLCDEDRRHVLRQRREHLAQSLHATGGRADADHALPCGGCRGLRQRRPCGFVRCRRAGGEVAAAHDARPGGRADLLRDLVRDGVEPVEVRGLRKEVHRAEFQRAHRRLRAFARERGDHDHRQRAHRHQVAQEVEAVHARHLHVQRDHVGRVLADALDGQQRVGRGAEQHHVGLRPDHARQEGAHDR